jgi:RNA polymerase sigma-70 factor (ECF subfamily)
MTESFTRLLQDMRGDDPGRLEVLAVAVQSELRSIAARHLARERPDHTLQPTALVNEAWLRLVDQREQSWENRAHFLAIASTAMRRVLLEHARARMAEKRGGSVERVTFFDVPSATDDTPEALVALDESLTAFARIDPENTRIVELRWFAGLDVAETAAVLGVSTRTVERGWRAAQAWLRDRIAQAG